MQIKASNSSHFIMVTGALRFDLAAHGYGLAPFPIAWGSWVLVQRAQVSHTPFLVPAGPHAVPALLEYFMWDLAANFRQMNSALSRDMSLSICVCTETSSMSPVCTGEIPIAASHFSQCQKLKKQNQQQKS